MQLNEIRNALEGKSSLPPHEVELIHFELRVAVRINELRKERGWTREELARRMGKKKSYISRVLRGENITLRTVMQFQQALGADILHVAGSIQTPESRARQAATVFAKIPIAQKTIVVQQPIALPHSQFERISPERPEYIDELHSRLN